MSHEYCHAHARCNACYPDYEWNKQGDCARTRWKKCWWYRKSFPDPDAKYCTECTMEFWNAYAAKHPGAQPDGVLVDAPPAPGSGQNRGKKDGKSTKKPPGTWMPKQDDLSQSRSSRGTKSIDSWSDKWENVGDANARSSKGDAPQDDSKRMEEMKKEMVEIKLLMQEMHKEMVEMKGKMVEMKETHKEMHGIDWNSLTVMMNSLTRFLEGRSN